MGRAEAGPKAALRGWIDIARGYVKAGMLQHAKTAVAMARQIHGVDADVEHAQVASDLRRYTRRELTPVAGADRGGVRDGGGGGAAVRLGACD